MVLNNHSALMTTRNGQSEAPSIVMPDVALRMAGVEQSDALSDSEGCYPELAEGSSPLVQVLTMGFLSMRFAGIARENVAMRSILKRRNTVMLIENIFVSGDSHKMAYCWACTLCGPFLKGAYKTQCCISPFNLTGLEK